jgi:drug/metabolite transporter (DMT)-like permease
MSDNRQMRAHARGAWRRRRRRLGLRAARWPPTLRALLWSSAAGLIFSLLNALMRSLTQQLDPFQSQFLRYLFGLLVLLPVVWHRGLANYRPRRIGGQFWRGGVHTVGLCLWFSALPKIPLADVTALGFTTPLFIMCGAWAFFREPMRWERWLATAIGFAGVLIVVGPRLSGSAGVYNLVMLASAPMFAASFLLTKALTRYETTGVILVWQSLTVSIFSLPLAFLHWQAPTPWQWAGFAVCGLLGSAGHYCLTRSFRVADISATQSVKFLDLVWAALLGWLVFADVPTQTTLIGGAVICAATIWVARRESTPSARAAPHEPAVP